MDARAKHEWVLIIAGYGAMGQAFVELYPEYIASFRTCYVLDKEIPQSGSDAVSFYRLDVTDRAGLESFLAGIRGHILFINVTAGIDTVALRTALRDYPVLYIDTACSMIAGSAEYRYSRLMPHTCTPVGNRHAHLLCCGLNPGLVELLIRRVAREQFAGSSLIDVMLYERDTLSSTAARPGLVPVSWSADTLIEEVLLSPTLEVADGEAVEGNTPPSQCAPLNWFGETIDARLVGHEEIWNMRQVEGSVVRRCAYAYAFSAEVMEVLRQGVGRARESLYVPDLTQEIQGEDTLAIKVADVHTGRAKALAWHLDHGRVWRRLGINAVQYQVCSSIRLFCEIMFSGCFHLRPLQHGSSIHISDSGWRRIAALMDRLGMHWEEIDSEGIHLLDERFSAAGFTA